MSSTTTLAQPALPPTAPAAARTVFALLRKLHIGVLDVQLFDGTQLQFGHAREGEPRAAMRLLDWSPCRAVLKSGDIGLAESYIEGRWSTPDLAALLRLFLANREAIDKIIYGSLLGSLWYRVKHLLRRNSRQGSRKNIHAHYDIGNAFYTLWLDGTMNYSSALFEGDLAQSTEAAQLAKMRRALRECGIQPGQRLLEIGCGWGAVAELAATEFDAKVLGVTLSHEQLAFGQERLRGQPKSASGELRLQDYRDLDEAPFDAIVSIEMFEAVGRAYWGEYFATLRRQLAPLGRACVQTITIRDDLFERYVRSTDFIQQYIFPGGMLPSAQVFRAEAAKAGLEVVDEFAFGADYAETLRRWRVQFLAHETEVRRQGFDTRFMRTWEYYLAVCEAAFEAGNTSVVQFTLRHR
jgi:cyclopropane-fatty-acyl-phospholipid synthase